ncbi:hypothetical protein MA16_Dca010964 [Dendrobium catenatum]|uniref:Uncharacterized protein n=1 Tax=Dendrobium catenatum TaxID=906689 RepID=A0A2I0WVQ2_9ASPA|nr:hypothetical protein MA16_Dca010964 [Dendrobium catenatum]
MCSSRQSDISPSSFELWDRWRRRRHLHRLLPVVVEESSPDEEVRQYCLCSPTHHPRSFRCRYHMVCYKWTAARA